MRPSIFLDKIHVGYSECADLSDTSFSQYVMECSCRFYSSAFISLDRKVKICSFIILKPRHSRIILTTYDNALESLRASHHVTPKSTGDKMTSNLSELLSIDIYILSCTNSEVWEVISLIHPKEEPVADVHSMLAVRYAVSRIYTLEIDICCPPRTCSPSSLLSFNLL